MSYKTLSDDKYYMVYRREFKGRNWREISVFDLDGVLVDNSERLKATVEELGLNPSDVIRDGYVNISDRDLRKSFWSIFLSDKYMHLDKPRKTGIELLRKAREEGQFIVILSGRTESTINETLRQLNDFGIEWDMVVHRCRGNYAKDVEFKTGFVNKYLGGIVYEFHDDSLSVCRVLAYGLVERGVTRIFESNGSGGLIYDVVDYEVYAEAFFVARHKYDLWYNLLSNVIVIVDSNGRMYPLNIGMVYIKHPLDSGKDVLRNMPSLSFPVELKWMWYSAKIVSDAELLDDIREIDYTIRLYAQLTDYEVIQNFKTEFLEFNGNGRTWRVENILSKPLIIGIKNNLV